MKKFIKWSLSLSILCLGSIGCGPNHNYECDSEPRRLLDGEGDSFFYRSSDINTESAIHPHSQNPECEMYLELISNDTEVQISYLRDGKVIVETYAVTESPVQY